MKKDRKKNSVTRFCTRCKTVVTVKEDLGFFPPLRGIIMFFSGIAPGKRESQLLRCPKCNSELAED